MKKILIFLSLIIWTNVFPQITFQKTYGGDNHDQGWDVIQLSDSSYVIAGGSRSFGNTNADFYLIKVNKYGDLLWQKTYGGSENDFCYSFEKTLDKGFILAGSTSSFGALEGDYYFVKVDSMGNFEWQQNLISSNYDRLNDVFQSIDSCYYFLGETNPVGAGYRKIQVLKTDATGNTIWLKTYEIGIENIANSFIQTSDSNIVIVGGKNISSELEPDVLLMKIDYSGSEMWSRTIGGSLSDVGEHVTETIDKGFMICGNSRSFSVDSINRLYIIKTDSVGDTTWTKSYGSSLFYSGRRVTQTTDNGFIVTGSTESVGSYSSLFLLKLDENYNEEWNVIYDGSAYSSIQTLDEGFMVVGCIKESGSYIGDWDLNLLKTDNMGATTSISQNIINQKIEIFPNPTTERIFINAINLKRIEISDSNGREVYNKDIQTKQQEIDLSMLAKGIYLIKIITTDGISVNKIIKE